MSSSYKFETTDNGFYGQKAKASFRTSIDEGDCSFFRSEGSFGAKGGVGGSSLNAKIGTSLFRGGDEYAEIKVLSGAAKAKAGVDDEGISARVKAGLNLIETEVVGIRSNLGINADTGVSIGSDGIETKLVGVGFKVGKEIGISTPIGGISFDVGKFWDNVFG
jgi:hypothetical protein